MCGALGAGSVTTTYDGTTVRWVFDTRKWLSGGATVDDTWFDDVVIDGSRATLADVRARLRVLRLAGDETLVESLALMVEQHRAHVDHLLADLAGQGGRLTLVEALLDDAQELVERVQPARLDADREVLAKAQEDLARTEDEYRQHAEALAVLQRAIEVRSDLARLLQRAPDLDRRISQLDQQIAAAERDRTALNQQIREQTQRAAVSSKVKKDLDNARTTRDRNRRKLTAAVDRLSAAAAVASVKPDIRVVEAAIAKVAAELEQLERQKEAADAAPVLRRTLDGVSEPLTSAIASGHGNRTLIELHGDDVTVSEVASAVSDRRRALEGVPPAPESIAIAKEIQERRRRLSQLREIPDLLEERDRFERLYDANEERVQGLLGTGALEAAALAQELEAKRTAVDAQLLSLAAERAATAQKRAGIGGGATEQQLKEDLKGHLAEAGVPEEELDTRVAAESAAEEVSRRRIIAFRDQIEQLRGGIARQEAELQALRLRLADPTLSWLVAGAVPMPDDDRATAWLASLQGRLVKVRERVGHVRNNLQTVASSLGAIAAELRGREPDGTVYEGQLRRWLAREFSGWFDDPLVKRHLFPGATNVQVNLATRQVQWDLAGRTESRPLSAFSSGEQAFAYTQARLARLAGDSPPDVRQLIVLDEFGSFIAENRLTTLYDLLRERIAQRPLDQVLIILPVRDDYKDLADSAVGAQRSHYEALDRELSNSGYVVQDLTP
jgi:hypothetical protein